MATDKFRIDDRSLRPHTSNNDANGDSGCARKTGRREEQAHGQSHLKLIYSSTVSGYCFMENTLQLLMRVVEQAALESKGASDDMLAVAHTISTCSLARFQ